MYKFNFVLAFLLSLSTFIVGSTTYILLDLIQRNVFFGLYRMFMYHVAFPFQYIALVSIIFGIIGACWIKYFGQARGYKRHLTIVLAICLTVILSSVPGGVLWTIHDMQAGYFPEGKRFWTDLLWGAKQGVFVGPFIAVFSFPFNLVGILYGFFALIFGARISSMFLTSEKTSDQIMV